MPRKKPKKTKSLRQAIEDLPTPDVEGKDIKELALMLLLETRGSSAGHVQAKVAALKVLADLVKEENKGKDNSPENALSNEVLTRLLSRKEN